MIYGFIIIAICLCGMFVYMKDMSKRIDDIPSPKEKFSFAPFMELVELPVLVMTNNGKKLGFIIDSGSNGCYIDKAALEGLDIDELTTEEKSSETATGGGVIASSLEKCTMKLHLGKYVFTVPFSIEDMSSQFNFIKDSEGVQLHGLLGNNFLAANDWVVDFEEYVVYMKEKK